MSENDRKSVICVKIFNPVEILACDQQVANEVAKVLDNTMRSNGHARPLRTAVNEMYAVVENRVWKRITIMEIIGGREMELKVKYIDYGLQGLVNASKLIALPKELKMIEPATKRYNMPGLLPVSMNTVCTSNVNRPIQARQSVSKNWSEAARSWFLRVAEDNDKKFEIRPLTSAKCQGPVSCEIFVRPDGLSPHCSLADLLIERKFAVRPKRRSISPGASPPEARAEACPAGPRENSPSGSSDDLSAPEVRLMQCSGPVGESAPDGEKLDLARMERAVFRMCPVRAPDPILSFDRSPLAVSIKRCLTKHRVGYLLFVQAHMTPVILRGMDVLAVAPRNKGKTTGLLMPLLTRICAMAEDPTTMPRGTGPFVIVVCPSWTKVRQCADYAEEFVRQSPSRCFRSLRIVAAYGGLKSDANAEIEVTLGCELLVTTPRLLVRLLEKGLIDFERLEALAMDGIDVMAEFYLEEIKKIVLARKKKTNQNQPHQVIATASSWTPAVTSFSKVCMHNAVEVYALGGVLEAAIRMEMPHLLLPCNDGVSKLETLVSFLVEVDLSKDAVVICTNSGINAGNIYRFLQERFAWERVLLLGEEEQTDEQKYQVTACWNAQMREGKRMPVLVAFDYQNAPPLNIRTASVLIHFDLAAKADALFRYHFVRAAMENFQPDRPLGVRCYYMYNPKRWAETPVRSGTDKVVEAVSFLQRVQPALPEELMAISHNRKAALEIANGYSSLCHQLRDFGRCRIPGCRERHTVLGEVDRPQLPISGEVEFQMIHARSANHIYARLLSHRPDSEEEECTDYREAFLTLQTEMNDFYLNPENQRILTLAEIQPSMLVGVLAVTLSTNHYRRARVMCIENQKRSRKVKVMLLDEGRVLLLDPDRLMELPKYLQELPGQAIELIVSRFQPLDEDTEFTPETTEEATKLLMGAVFRGRIALCLGNTLWLSSVSQHIHYRATQTHVLDNDLRMELMDKGLAVDNPDHINNLVKLCRGQVDVARSESPGRYLTRRFTYQKTPLELSQLDDADVTYALCGDVQSPQFFHVILDDFYDLLWHMVDDINDHIESVRRFPSRAVLPGQFALCMWEKTEDWNRVLILEAVPGNEEEDEKEEERYHVRFVDFGETEIVPRQALRQLPDQYRELPATAIECSLANCQPVSPEGWSPQTQDILMDFFYDGGNRQLLDVKVVVKRPASDGSRTHYVVDVVQNESKRNLALHLIIEGLALGNVELAEQVFPLAKERISPLHRRMSPVHIAFDLFTCQDYRLRADLCESLFQTVTKWAHLNPSIRRRYTGTELCGLLARLVRFCCPVLELYFLYRALLPALDMQEAGEAFAQQEDAAELTRHAVQHLQRLQQTQELSAEQRQRLLLAISGVLRRLMTGALCCDAFLKVPRWSAVVSAFLQPEEEEEVIRSFLELSLQIGAKASVDDMMTLSKSNLTLIDHLPLLSTCWEAALTLIEQHSKISGAVLRWMLSADAMALLWRKLSAFQARQEPPSSLQLHAFVSAATELWLRGDQKRRVQFVKAEDRSPVLDWLVATCTSPKVGALIFDMRMEISRARRTASTTLSALLKPKSQQTVVLKPRISPVMITIGEKYRAPHVSWFQGRKFLFLVIAVQKLNSMKISPIIMTDRSVHFSALSQGETLAFDLPLCYPVDPPHSLIKITEFELRVKIRKAEMGFWARVTPDRHTPMWLTQNMDHAGYQASEAPVSMVEKAEDDSGFVLPCVKHTVRQHLSGYLARSRMRYRRRMERIGRSAAGPAPEIDAGDWLLSQGAEAYFPSRCQSVTTPAGEGVEKEAEEENEELDMESDDDSFYEESSDSDMEDLDEVLGDQTRNPAVEDCVDHFWNW